MNVDEGHPGEEELGEEKDGTGEGPAVHPGCLLCCRDGDRGGRLHWQRSLSQQVGLDLQAAGCLHHSGLCSCRLTNISILQLNICVLHYNIFIFHPNINNIYPNICIIHPNIFILHPNIINLYTNICVIHPNICIQQLNI